jgi:hypothetical protein
MTIGFCSYKFLLEKEHRIIYFPLFFLFHFFTVKQKTSGEFEMQLIYLDDFTKIRKS